MKFRTMGAGVLGLAMLSVLGTGCDQDAIKASADKATASAQRAEAAAARAEAAADKASSSFHRGLKK